MTAPQPKQPKQPIQPIQPIQLTNSLEAADLLALTTTAMPYGKYKGSLLCELPGHYLNWFARAGFPKGKLGQQLALMQEIDSNGLKGLLSPLKQG